MNFCAARAPVPRDKIDTGNEKELKDYIFISKLLNNL